MALRGLDGKVAVVTGGGSGMGAATSARLSGEGVRVVVVDVREDAAKEVAANLPGDSIAVGADVSTVDGVDTYVRAAADAFGRIDLFHNNAGFGGDLVPIWEMPVEQFDHTLGVNTRGVFLGLRAVLGQMARQRAGGDWSGGAIVNTASVAGLRGVPGQAAYGASKHAVVGLTKVAALDATPLGVRVNAVCPGLVRTPMLQGLIDVAPPELVDGLLARVPAGRLAEADEVAALVAWLLCDEASYVNGECVVVDGGIAAG
ncbi:MAG TPA: glucose 1-dehydrogenase [Acidimicrobiia bacterium]|nr:glucose 1-dehydrogenase [Acidimicrobiia bacterium]